MRLEVRLLLVLLATTGATGCGLGSHHAGGIGPDRKLLEDATGSYGRAHACPAERLHVRSSNLPLSDLLETGKPPADIAADPERKAVWERSRQEDIAGFDRFTAFDVAGGGSHAVYFCWYGHEIHRDHECAPVDLDVLALEPTFLWLPMKPTAAQLVRERLGLPPGSPLVPVAEASAPSPVDVAAEVRAQAAAIRRRVDAMAKETSDATVPAPASASPNH